IVTWSISLIIAASTAIWIALSISRGLGRASTLAQAVAAGDLTKTVDNRSHDDIGHLNAMVERLRGVVMDASGASGNVSSGSQELSSTAEQMSQGATEQASAAEE